MYVQFMVLYAQHGIATFFTEISKLLTSVVEYVSTE